MILSEILKDVDVIDTNLDLNINIESVTNNSKKSLKNSCFVAIKGYSSDGHKFINDALLKGASVVVCQEKPGEGVPYVLVKDTRKELSKISANFYNKPSEKMNVIGITGTNGKTTTTYLVKHILECAGKKVGLIGTNQNMIGDKVIETERTTPESVELQELLAEMVENKCTNVVMEVSSHSLVLDRVCDIKFNTGAFTNISQDHLDFHKTMEEYAKAKAILFSQCENSAINLDDEYSKLMLENAAKKVITFAINDKNADVLATDIQMFSDKVCFNVQYLGQTQYIEISIPGEFTVYNTLTAITTCILEGVSLSDCAKYLKSASGVKGRVEVVCTNTDYTVLIDYAHSPDGIENVLKAVKGFAKGRVVALFGCGGDRDRTKRPLMAKASAKYADFCIITSDNPRTEQPEDIISDILVGLEGEIVPYEVIADRRKAIVWALDNAKKDDIIVLMGKGHETYQEINGVKHHLDEREEVLNYFA